MSTKCQPHTFKTDRDMREHIETDIQCHKPLYSMTTWTIVFVDSAGVSGGQSGVTSQSGQPRRPRQSRL